MSLNPGPQTQLVNRILLLASLALILLASCTPDSLQGRVVLSGSATLAPVVTRGAEAWKRDHPRVDLRIEAIGSDAGLERLIQFDEADLALVSRPLNDQDRVRARSAGHALIELPLAWDAVCLVVPLTNTWARSLTTEQAARAFTTAQKWSDLDARWPDLPLHRFVLGPRSGTSDIFAGALLGGQKGRLYAGAEVQSSEDDRILARGLAQVEGSIGFLGWTTVRESDLRLRVVALDGVEPTEASIQARTYGLPRELWLIGTEEGWRTKPAVRSLVRSFYHSYTELLTGTSLIPLSPEEQHALDAVLKRDQ